MRSLALIVGVAVIGAVSLTAVSVLTAVVFERRRHNRILRRHNVERTMSMLQRPTQLSIGDLSYNTLPRPGRGSLRRSLALSPGETSRISRFYSTLPSQDDICAPPRSSQDSAQRMPSFEAQRPSTVPSPSAQRKKKIPALSISGTCVGSPMSAITEMTEPRLSPGPAVVTVSRSQSTSYTFPDAVELPTEITPTRTPEKISDTQALRYPQQTYQRMHDSIDGKISIFSSPPIPMRRSPEHTSHSPTAKTRSVSLGSLASPGPPPEVELPQLPADAAQLPRTSLRRSRTSHSGLDRMRYTIVTVPPAPDQPLTVPADTSAFGEFTFGFDRSSTIEEQPVQKATAPHDPDHAAPRRKPTLTIDIQAAQAGSGFKTINIETKTTRPPLEAAPATPTLPSQKFRPDSRPASMWNYELFISSPSRSLKSEVDRRTSVSSVENFRRSVTSPMTIESPGHPHKRGHKRQNCVRISGLAPPTAKQRLSQQLNRLSIREDELEDVSTPNARPIELEARRVGSDHSSIMTSPLTSSPALPSSQGRSNMSLRVRGPRLVTNRIPSAESTPSGSTRTITPPKLRRTVSPKIPRQDSASPRPPLAESAVHGIRMNSTPSPQSAGKTPSPFKLSPYKSSPMIASPSRQKSKIGGPRNQPSSRKLEHSASPLRAKSTAAKSSVVESVSASTNSGDDDLQKSITMLKSLKLDLVKEMTFQPPVTAVAMSSIPIPLSYGSISPPKMRKRSSTVAGHRHESQSEGGRARLKQAQEEYQTYLEDKNYDVRPSTKVPSMSVVSDSAATAAPVTTKSGHDLPTSTSTLSIWEDQSVREDSPDTTNRSTRQSSPERVLRKQRLEASNRKASTLNLNLAIPKPLQIHAKREILRERIDAFESTAARFVPTPNSGSSPVKSRSPLGKVSDNLVMSSPPAIAAGPPTPSDQSQHRSQRESVKILSDSPTASLPHQRKEMVTANRQRESGQQTDLDEQSPNRGRRNHTPNLAQLRLEIDRQRLRSVTVDPRVFTTSAAAGTRTRTDLKLRSATDTTADKEPEKREWMDVKTRDGDVGLGLGLGLEPGMGSPARNRERNRVVSVLIKNATVSTNE